MIRAAAILLVLLAALASSPAPASAAPLAQPASACETAIAAALTKLSAPYVWGAKGPNSFDCSGLTYWAYQQAGIDIGISTYDQQAAGQAIPCDMSDFAGAATECWAPGDLVFLRYPGGQHVALYAGNGLVVDAYNESTGVILHNPAADSFYQAHFWQGRRVASGCESLAINPGTPGSLPAGTSPSLESIADIISPITLLMPWSCGLCVVGQSPIELLAYPAPALLDVLYPFKWLGVWLWNEIARPVICWLLAIAQALLNGIATAFNAVLVAGVNLIWRLFVLLLLWFRDSFLALWLLLADLRLQLYGLQLPDLGGALGDLAAFVAGAGELIMLVLVELGELALGLAEGLLYLAGLFFALGPALVEAIGPDVEPPPQLVGISSNVFFSMFVDVFRAIADSSLGWAWVAFVGLVYLRFVQWLLAELSKLNQ